MDQLRYSQRVDIQANLAPSLRNPGVPVLTPDQRSVVVLDAIPDIVKNRDAFAKQLYLEQHNSAGRKLLDPHRSERELKSAQATIDRVEAGDVAAIDSIQAEYKAKIATLQTELARAIADINSALPNDAKYGMLITQKDNLARQIPVLSVSGREAELQSTKAEITNLNIRLSQTVAGGHVARQQAIELEIGNLHRQIQALDILKQQTPHKPPEIKSTAVKPPEREPSVMDLIGAFMDAETAMMAKQNEIYPAVRGPGGRSFAQNMTADQNRRFQLVQASLVDIRGLTTLLANSKVPVDAATMQHAKEMYTWWLGPGSAQLAGL